MCTSSLLKDVKPLVAALVSRRIHVLTTCEELAYPVPARVAAFREIDRLARARKVSVLATGVNPGFAMDTLALALTAPCAAVRRVSVTRVVDAGARRLPLQRRVGAGLNLGQFRRAVTEGTVRHVGLVESAHMIAGALGLEARPRRRDARARDRTARPRHRVPAHPGRRGRRHPPVACARTAASELAVSLDLQVYVGAESPRDHVLVDGDPPVDATIVGRRERRAWRRRRCSSTRCRACSPPAPGLLNAGDLPLVHALNPQELASLPARKR